MSESNREFLSAGMDGELSREEIRFLLRRLEADAGLADVWSRYHAGRDGLRREALPPLSVDFASRVMAAIDAEPAAAVAVAPRRRWLHWSAGGAIAASVAVAALMLSQPAGRHSAAAEVARHSQVTGEAEVADATPAPPAAPVAPQWLNGNDASQFTQKAAFDSSSEGGTAYLPRSMPYQIHRARAASDTPDSNASNGYMLLVRPDGSRYVQPVAQPAAR